MARLMGITSCIGGEGEAEGIVFISSGVSLSWQMLKRAGKRCRPG